MKFPLLFALLSVAVVLGLPAQTPKAWTVLVYMAADNDLEPSALDDLTEMMQAAAPDQFNLVVQIDRAPGYSDDPIGGLPNFTDAKRLLVQNGKLKELADLGETNTADPKTLAAFVTWGLKAYPAQKTALVLWDHGGGQAGFGVDETSDGAMLSQLQIKQGIGDGLKGAGVARLDLLGFDACLMSDLETARLEAPFARYLLASEETEPGFGWDWRSLAILGQKPDTTAPALASKIIASFADFCKKNDEGAQFTLALSDLDKVPAVEAALKGLDGAALPQLKALGGEFGRARFTSVEFGKSGDPADDTHMVDLGDLARQWQSVPKLAAPAQALAAAVKAMVVEQKVGTVQKNATGLSIWFPSEAKYYDPGYASFGPPAWVELLNGYYKTGATLAPEERADAADQTEAPDDGVSFADGQATLTRTFDKKILKNIADALLYYGTIDPQGVVQVLGSRDAEFDRKTGEVSGTWDLSALTIVQGKVRVPVFLSEDQAADGQTAFSVPFSYYPDGKLKAKTKQSVWLTVTVDDKSGDIVEETFYQESDALVAEFHPAKGSRIVAQLLERNTKGDWDYVDRGAALDPTQPLNYEYKDVPPSGKFYLSLDVTDIGGNNDSQEFEGALN